MASLYQRDGSPFYWIKYRKSDGTIGAISTKCRIGLGPDERRARLMRAEYEAKELQDAPRRGDSGGWNWVPVWLETRYASKPVTLERYGSAWGTIKLFLEQTQIARPVQLQRRHCFDYLNWRQKPDKSKGKYRAGHNTALLELRILRIIMQEAVVRELCTGNPCLALGIPKAERKLKPELTDEDCELIRSKIELVKNTVVRQMLATSFEISRYQGCRLKETKLHVQRDVDLANSTITFRAKGGKTFSTALHPKLVPLFERLREEGRQLTWEEPDNAKHSRQWASTNWTRFLSDSGLKETLGDAVCFHCNRVTVVTRLARANVPISKAKSYVGHASDLIHETYQRLQPGDLGACVDALG